MITPNLTGQVVAVPQPSIVHVRQVIWKKNSDQ